MALKTFNVDAEAYKEFSDYCKKEGISMSKKVEKFIREEMEAIKGRAKKIVRKVKVKVGKEMKDVVGVKGHPLSKYC
jgi:hypothetical protein